MNVQASVDFRQAAQKALVTAAAAREATIAGYPTEALATIMEALHSVEEADNAIEAAMTDLEETVENFATFADDLTMAMEDFRINFPGVPIF